LRQTRHIGITQVVHGNPKNFPRVQPIKGACLGTCSKKLASNAFVVNVNAAGTALVYSTVIGGSASDQGKMNDGPGPLSLARIAISDV
jgi:hypothetical protein